MIMEAILFSTVFTAAIGYPYWRFTKGWGQIATPLDDLNTHEPTNQEIRQSPEYRAWNYAVKRRDRFQCIWCHSTDNLEAHHLYSFASFPELRFDIKNGISLCHDCHKLTPNYGSKEKVFSKQLKSQ